MLNELKAFSFVVAKLMLMRINCWQNYKITNVHHKKRPSCSWCLTNCKKWPTTVVKSKRSYGLKSSKSLSFLSRMIFKNMIDLADCYFRYYCFCDEHLNYLLFQFIFQFVLYCVIEGPIITSNLWYIQLKNIK